MTGSSLRALSYSLSVRLYARIRGGIQLARERPPLQRWIAYISLVVLYDGGARARRRFGTSHEGCPSVGRGNHAARRGVNQQWDLDPHGLVWDTMEVQCPCRGLTARSDRPSRSRYTVP